MKCAGGKQKWKGTLFLKAATEIEHELPHKNVGLGEQLQVPKISTAALRLGSSPCTLRCSLALNG